MVKWWTRLWMLRLEKVEFQTFAHSAFSQTNSPCGLTPTTCHTELAKMEVLVKWRWRPVIRVLQCCRRFLKILHHKSWNPESCYQRVKINLPEDSQTRHVLIRLWVSLHTRHSHPNIRLHVFVLISTCAIFTSFIYGTLFNIEKHRCLRLSWCANQIGLLLSGPRNSCFGTVAALCYPLFLPLFYNCSPISRRHSCRTGVTSFVLQIFV